MPPNEKEFLTRIAQRTGIIQKISRLYMESREDSRDLFQEIILQLWKSHKQFREESEYSTWMYRVALNTAMTFMKKEKRRKNSEAIMRWSETSEDPLSANSSGNIEKLYAAAATLNPVEKALLLLWLEEQRYSFIAQQLGISEGTARVRLSRIKDKLQEIINKS